jgi:hypothetical protein
MDPEAVRSIWEDRPRIEQLSHEFGQASWLVIQPSQSDRKSWWATASSSDKYAYLKGKYIEHHRAVIETVDKDCPTCGGEGIVHREGHRGQETIHCPYCLGVRKVRELLYY